MIGFVAVVAGMIAWIAAARVQEFWIGLAQDRCSFGPVSNARYREWLAKANDLRRREGRLISWKHAQIAPRRYEGVTDRLFDELSRGVTSVEERLAIVHAMMRADGFLLLSTWPDEQDPYANAMARVGFNYGRYSLSGLLVLCVFDCKDRAYANLNLRDENAVFRPGDRYRRNQFGFSLSPGPDAVSLTRYYVPPPAYPRTCPPMPTPSGPRG